LSGGYLNSSKVEYVGQSGPGTFSQTGGTNAVGTLDVGVSAFGSYTLSAGNLFASLNYENIGYQSNGIFTQSGGSNITQNLTLGGNFGYASSGSYALGGGYLNVTSGNESIGQAGGPGNFVQTGGTNSISLGFSITITGGSNGTSSYSLSGNGVVNTNGETIGNQASFTQTGGCNLASIVTLGANGATGSVYNLSGNSFLSATSDEYVGYGSGGAMNQSGGTNSTGTLVVGDGSVNAAATYTLSGGTLIVAGNETIGEGNTYAASINQTGGVNTSGSFTITGLYNQSAGTANTGNLTINTNGTYVLAGTLNLTGSNEYVNMQGSVLNLSGGSINATGSATLYLHSGTIVGGGIIPAFIMSLGGGTISPGDPAIQTYTAGMNLSDDSNYDWQVGSSLKDNSTGTPGIDFDLVQVTGGILTLGPQSTMTVNLGLLSPADQPGGANNNPFWKSSHIWTVLSVSGLASNTGATNFFRINNGRYSTGSFATQIDADGQSIDLVYNEMNIATGGANNTLLGTITLTGGPIPSGSATAGGVTSGSFDIAGITSSNQTPLSVLMDVQGSSNSISQWYSEIKGAQLLGGAQRYSASQVGPGYGTVPSWGNVPGDDDGFLLSFSNTNLAGSGDPYVNFDWGAGNSGVTLDQVFVAPEPSVVGFLGFGIAAMLKRRRRGSRVHT